MELLGFQHKKMKEPCFALTSIPSDQHSLLKLLADHHVGISYLLRIVDAVSHQIGPLHAAVLQLIQHFLGTDAFQSRHSMCTSTVQ